MVQYTSDMPIRAERRCNLLYTTDSCFQKSVTGNTYISDKQV
jgi:hypothetical protein